MIILLTAFVFDYFDVSWGWWLAFALFACVEGSKTR
jgi:hypothetical protein